MVKDFLRHIGFTAVHEEGMLTVNTGPAVYQGPRFSRERLGLLLSQTFAVPVGSRQCARCEKQDCSNRCSACKQVYYCSRSCQAAHWATHKLQCNKTL